MRTHIQRALDPQVGDKLFFSNQSRIRSGERDWLSTSRIIREVVEKPAKGSDNSLYLSTISGPLQIYRSIFLDKYSPNLDALEIVINKIQKQFILLSYHGFHKESMDLLVQVEL